MPIAQNLRSRLDKLEAQIAPPSRVFIFTSDGDDRRSHAEQLAAFKAENGISPRDHLVVVTFDDAA